MRSSSEVPVRGIRIAGLGSYLPGPSLGQRDVAEFLRQWPDGLSTERQNHLLSTSGIEQRHFAIDTVDPSRRETNATMAAAAGRRALEDAGWEASDVDLLVVTTVVPDQLMPPTSVFVQELLGIESCTELEISANCTAPTKSLTIAANALRVGTHQRALVCNAQFASFGFVPPWTNPAAMGPEQGHLRWILSDGAAAIALEAGEPDIELRAHVESRGVGMAPGMAMALGAAHPDVEAAYAAGTHHAVQPPLYALKEGTRLATEGLERMLRLCELPGEAIDHFIPSVSSVQVADRMRNVFTRLGINPEAWRTNFARIGYIGSVAVPMMLEELSRDGRLKPGDLVCTVAEESSKWMFAGTVFRWNP